MRRNTCFRSSAVGDVDDKHVSSALVTIPVVIFLHLTSQALAFNPHVFAW